MWRDSQIAKCAQVCNHIDERQSFVRVICRAGQCEAQTALAGLPNPPLERLIMID